MALLAGAKRIPILIVGLTLAALGGAVFDHFNLPLAWVLGPLLVSSGLSMSGVEVFAPVLARRCGQMIVGVAVGLHITAEIAQSILIWLPVMVISTVFSIMIAAVFSTLLARIGRIDGITAYYATLPGGMAEMSNVGVAEGARAEPIALAQAIRVAVVVCLVPLFVNSLGIQQAFFDANQGKEGWMTLLMLVPAAAVGVGSLTFLGMKNSWMVGSLIGVGAVASFGGTEGQMPSAIFALGQYLIGLNVGTRFKREIVAALPRLAVCCAVTTAGLSSVLLLLAGVLSVLTGLDFSTASLSMAPGGLAEMSATAQVLHLSVVLITGFHIIRAISVNAFATQFRHGFERFGLFSFAECLVDLIIRKR